MIAEEEYALGGPAQRIPGQLAIFDPGPRSSTFDGGPVGVHHDQMTVFDYPNGSDEATGATEKPSDGPAHVEACPDTALRRSGQKGLQQP